MGLASRLMSGVSGQSKHVESFATIAGAMERGQDKWIAELRAAGVKAAHPDDGWVDRMVNRVQFVYPQFNDGAGVGDLVALGWPQWGHSKTTHRIVRLLEFRPNIFGGGSWKFEEYVAERKES